MQKIKLIFFLGAKYVVVTIFSVILIILSTNFLVSCSEKEKRPDEKYYNEPKYVDDYFQTENEEIEFKEKTVKIKYVADFSDLESDEPTYWYVYFEYNRNSIIGYTIIKLDRSYFSLVEARKKIKEEANINQKKYLGIKFFKQVTEAAYLEFVEYEKDG